MADFGDTGPLRGVFTHLPRVVSWREAPTTAHHQSCLFCDRHPQFVHLLDDPTFRDGYGDECTLAQFVTVCEECEARYERGADADLAALFDASPDDGDGGLIVDTFRRSDRGRRRLA